MDLKKLRAFLQAHKGEWGLIAKRTGYPRSSLQKFADGRVNEPRLSNLKRLAKYAQL